MDITFTMYLRICILYTTLLPLTILHTAELSNYAVFWHMLPQRLHTHKISLITIAPQLYMTAKSIGAKNMNQTDIEKQAGRPTYGPSKSHIWLILVSYLWQVLCIKWLMFSLTRLQSMHTTFHKLVDQYFVHFLRIRLVNTCIMLQWMQTLYLSWISLLFISLN